MSIIGFFTSISNAVDGHVLKKTNLNKQTKYYETEDLLYILSVVLIPYLLFCYLLVIMVILFSSFLQCKMQKTK